MDHESLLLGELREFKSASLERLRTLEAKIDSFQAFRGKVIGFASLSAFLATALATILADYLRH